MSRRPDVLALSHPAATALTTQAVTLSTCDWTDMGPRTTAYDPARGLTVSLYDAIPADFMQGVPSATINQSTGQVRTVVK